MWQLRSSLTSTTTKTSATNTTDYKALQLLCSFNADGMRRIDFSSMTPSDTSQSTHPVSSDSVVYGTLTPHIVCYARRKQLITRINMRQTWHIRFTQEEVFDILLRWLSALQTRNESGTGSAEGLVHTARSCSADG